MEDKVKKTEKLLNWLMGIAVAAMGLAATVLSVAGLTGFALPDWLIRTLGIVNLLALPVLVYSTVRKLRASKAAAQAPARTAATNGVKKPKKKKRKK